MKEYKFSHLTLEVEDTMRVAISEEEDFATLFHKQVGLQVGTLLCWARCVCVERL